MNISKFLLFLLFFLIVLALIIFFFGTNKDNDSANSEQGQLNQEHENEGRENIGSIENSAKPNGNEVSDGSEETSQEAEQLPEDLYTAECGYYFDNYGVCAGTCPEGVCTAEGRSCYCKNI